MAGIADIDVQPAVAVDVDHGDAGAPHAILAKAGFVGDVFKFEIPFVEIKLIGPHIGGEEDIGKAVVVDVADGYAAAVVKVAEEKTVIETSVLYGVLEPDAGAVGIQQGKHGLFLARVMAGKECEGSEQAGKDRRSGP